MATACPHVCSIATGLRLLLWATRTKFGRYLALSSCFIAFHLAFGTGVPKADQKSQSSASHSVMYHGSECETLTSWPIEIEYTFANNAKCLFATLMVTSKLVLSSPNSTALYRIGFFTLKKPNTQLGPLYLTRVHIHEQTRAHKHIITPMSVDRLSEIFKTGYPQRLALIVPSIAPSTCPSENVTSASL